MPKKTTVRYELNQSPFYRVSSIKALAKVLQWNGAPSRLRALSSRPDNFDEYDDVGSNGKVRHIEAPKPTVKRLQKRINELFKRLPVPDYLQSGTPGRSYLSNSEIHLNAYGATATLDVTEYYPSVSFRRVQRLFRNVFECPPDLAHMLAGILCCKGHLATGSPASALVAFHACRDMFNLVDARAKRIGATFTLYVDDIAVTGKTVGSGDLASIEKILAKFGFKIKCEKSRIFRARQAKIVTGRAIRNGVSRAPNKKFKKLHDTILAVEANPDNQELLRSAIGQTEHLALIDAHRSVPLKSQAGLLRKRLSK